MKVFLKRDCLTFFPMKLETPICYEHSEDYQNRLKGIFN